MENNQSIEIPSNQAPTVRNSSFWFKLIGIGVILSTPFSLLFFENNSNYWNFILPGVPIQLANFISGFLLRDTFGLSLLFISLPVIFLINILIGSKFIKGSNRARIIVFSFTFLNFLFLWLSSRFPKIMIPSLGTFYILSFLYLLGKNRFIKKIAFIMAFISIILGFYICFQSIRSYYGVPGAPTLTNLIKGSIVLPIVTLINISIALFLVFHRKATLFFAKNKI